MTIQTPQYTNQYSDLTTEELQYAFLKAAGGSNSDADNFFDKFKYKFDLFMGNPVAALQQGLDLLNRCHSIDEKAYTRIHKGTPYYWLGVASYLAQEFEFATFFFDAAVGEDLRAGANPINNPPPSIRFILIDEEPTDQAARTLVQHTRARVEELINNYNSRPGRLSGSKPLTMVDIRKRFLLPSISIGKENLRSSATTFISFNIEWDYRNLLLDIIPLHGTAEPFFLHLFKGCLLFESLLKCNPVKQLPENMMTLGPTLQFLHKELNIPSTLDIGNIDFPTIVNGLAQSGDSIQTAIQYTGQLRNTLGHNLGWVVSLNKLQYSQLFRMVSSSCFHVISCLYQ
jgi:hypothetical protein